MNILQEIFLEIVNAISLFIPNNNIALMTIHSFLWVIWFALILGLFVIPVFYVSISLFRDFFLLISKGGYFNVKKD